MANDSCKGARRLQEFFPQNRKLPGRPQEVAVVGKLVPICAGGAIGSGPRNVTLTWGGASFNAGLPLGTLIGNVVRSLLIAGAFEVSLRYAAITSTVCLFLTTVVLGSFSTYSSFSYENPRLFEDGTIGLALLNLALPVLGCLTAGALGLLSSRARFGESLAGR